VLEDKLVQRATSRVNAIYETDLLGSLRFRPGEASIMRWMRSTQTVTEKVNWCFDVDIRKLFRCAFATMAG